MNDERTEERRHAASQPGEEGVTRAVSIVIPAFNEGPNVASEIRGVQEVISKTGWDFEIIVVDDGSSDDTGANADIEGVRVISHRRNRGYGAALKTGISQAKYDWILITDADGTYPPAAIPALLEQAAENDMVVGARTGASVKIPLIRRPAKWFLRALASYLAGQKLPDLNSGLRLIRKDLVSAYSHLLPSGFSFTTTISLAATCNEYDVSYVPIDYHQRVGKSKIRARHAYDFLILILRTIVFFNPLKVFIPMGTVLAVAGLAKFGYDLTLSNLSESAVFGILGAMIIWSIGLLADQNARLAKRP